MDAENRQGQISKEEQIRLTIESGLPTELRGLITEVKLGKDDKGIEQALVSVCAWHNSKQNMNLLSESLPKGILISHGMCDSCFKATEE